MIGSPAPSLTPDPTVARIRAFQDRRRAATEELRARARARRTRRGRAVGSVALAAGLLGALAGAYHLGELRGRRLAVATPPAPAIAAAPAPAPAAAPAPAPAAASLPATAPEAEPAHEPAIASPLLAAGPGHAPVQRRTAAGAARLSAPLAIETRVHVVHLTSIPEGAEVTVDHVPTHRRTPTTIELLPAEVGPMVEVDLHADGHASRRAILSFHHGFRDEGDRRVRDVTLSLEPSPAAPSVPPTLEDRFAAGP